MLAVLPAPPFIALPHRASRGCSSQVPTCPVFVEPRAAEQEDRVEALIDQQRSRVDLGLFVVRLCVGGHWRQVLVDDSFPCYSSADDGQGPIFSHSKGARAPHTSLESYEPPPLPNVYVHRPLPPGGRSARR